MEGKAVDQKPILQHPTIIEVQPSSPRYTPASTVAGAPRKIAIPVDLSDESAYAVRWAVQNYLRPGDAVTLVHVRPTSVLYGADWGSTHFTAADDDDDDDSKSGDDEIKKKKKKKKKLEDEFDSFTAGKIAELAQPLVDSKVGFKVHVVKDHDMKERLCLEIERLGMSVVIMGSRGFGASRRDSKARLGSVSDYCVHHCICPVVVVRYPEEDTHSSAADLHPVPEEKEDPHTHPHHVSKLHLHSD